MLFFKKKETYSFVDIGLTTDVHSHILPGVDDGSSDMEDSLTILERMHELGIRRIVLTPHVSRTMFPNEAGDLRHRYEDFLAALPDTFRNEIRFHLASEYMVDEFFSQIDDRLRWPDGSTLIEMSYYVRSREIRDTVFNIRMDGGQPILAHPERYVFYQKAFDKKRGVAEIQELFDMGCKMQLNVMSLTGAYGEPSMGIVRWMLDNNLYEYIGTDVHARQQIDRFTGFRVNAVQMDKVRQLARNNDTIFG